jgi:hypothetical protein
MKFAVNKTISHVNREVVLVLERNERYFETNPALFPVKYICCALIKVTEDWDENDPLPIVSSTDSIQIRPKSIFKSTKGYYYKSTKTIYLTDDEVSEMNEFIENIKNYI